MLDFARARRHMVDGQLRTSDVTDLAVLEAFDTLPREDFVREADRPLAYLDRSLIVGEAGGETRRTVTPFVLARLIQAAAPFQGQRALHVACGLGYGSAILAKLGAVVTGLESVPGLAEAARGRLAAAGFDGVTMHHGGLADGVGTESYDIILIEGAFEVEPRRLLAALAPGGRLVGVSATGATRRAVAARRVGAGTSERTLLEASAPLLEGFRRAPEFVL